MARIEVDDATRTVIVDLHQYSTSTALVVLDTKIKEGWRGGLDALRVIHGAPDVDVEDETYIGVRGSIKREVLRWLEEGEWAEFVQSYDPQNGSTTILLKPNPHPQERSWSNLPEDEYGGGRHWGHTTYPRAPSYTSKQVQKDADAIANAIVRDAPHFAVQTKGDLRVITLSEVVLDAREIPKRTLDGRRRRLREAIDRRMQKHPDWERTSHGSKIAYSRRISK